MIDVHEITNLTQNDYDQIIQLTPQLSSSTATPSLDDIEKIVHSESSILLAAFDTNDQEKKILGMLTLVVYRIPTGIRADIEDVVVDSQCRGRGIGESLVKAALVRAKEEKAITVDLTSRPSREAANRLYRRCGFSQRETNIYRYQL